MDDLVISKSLINKYVALMFKFSVAGIVLVIFSTLFLFTSLTTDFYETSKFIVLLLFVVFALNLFAINFVLEGKVTFVRTPFDIPLLLLGAVAVISTIMSPSPYVSLLGNQARIHPSLVALIGFILFYFLMTNILRSFKQIQFVNWVLIGCAALLAILSLVVYAGVKILPPPWAHDLSFTTTGSTFSTTAILAMLLPFLVTGLLQQGSFFGIKSYLSKIIFALLLAVFGITIALTGSLATYIAGVFAIGATIFINRKSLSEKTNLFFLGLSAALIVIVALLSFLPVPNLLRTQAQNFPREVQLDLITSWKVSVSAFRDSPFWGSGPATFLFDFTSYKPFEFNSTKLWNLRFDSPFNEYLQVLAALGGIGLFAMLSLTAMFISASYRALLLRDRLPSESRNEHSMTVATAIAGFVFFVILALHPASLPVWVMGLSLLACFASLNLLSGFPSRNSSATHDNSLRGILYRVATNISTTSSFKETIRVDALPSIILVITVSSALASFYFGGKIVLADYHHRLALNAAGQNQGLVAYNELVIAEKLNPLSDLYRTDIAQTNFVLANAIASAKGPTESSPSGSLTDEDKQNIQILLQQSINEGKTATALSPRSALNWEILALLYRQISGVAQNALVFSLDSYGRSIQQDPLNPQLRLNVGGVYYAIANYDLAIRFFTDAVNLKPDFANGYYNLSVALRDKGDLINAQAAAEQVVKLVEANSPDYKVANDYLTELKNRIASGSAGVKQNETVPPAAEQKGALEKKELPKVVNVGNPPTNIATPEAIKKPNSSPSPSSAN